MSGIKRSRGRQVPRSASVALHPAWQAHLDDHVIALNWSSDGTRLAAASISGPITIFDGREGHMHTTLAGHAMGTTALDWHPRQAMLASIGQDGMARVWNADSGQARHELATATAWGERVAWSPQGDLLASAAGRTIHLWNDAGQAVHAWDDHPSTVADIAWQPSGRLLAAATYGGITLWSPEQARPSRRYTWKGSTLVLAWSPDSNVIATGDQDSTVHFWYVTSGHDLQMWGYETKVLELAWHPSGRYLATGGGAVPCVWDCSGPKGPEDTRPVQLRAHAYPVRFLAYQHSGPLLASGSSDGGMALWQPDRTHKPLAWVDGAVGVTQLRWSPDDRALAVGREDGTVDVFALAQPV